MRRQIVIQQSKAARKAARLQLGPLRNQLVAPRTRQRYASSLQRFFLFLGQHGLKLPGTLARLDTVLSQFVEYLWESGDPLAYAQDAISGVQFHLPQARRHLQGAWRLVAGWRKSEVPVRATPCLPTFVVAVAAWPGFTAAEGLAVLVAFHCFLRTGEMLGLQWQHFQIGPRVGVVSLPSTKSGNRFNFVESVPISEPMLLQFLAKGKHKFV